jgi:hypothetical protein
MKYKVVALTLALFFLSLSPSFAQSIHYYVHVPYFPNGTGWWSGLAIENKVAMPNPLTISVFDSSGVNPVAMGQATTLMGKYEQDVRLLPQFITSGTLPTRGSITITGSQSFTVTFFVGTNTAFSMNIFEANAAP